MLNVEAPTQPDASPLALLVREHLDDLVGYATHLVGDAAEAIEHVAAAIDHLRRTLRAGGRLDDRVALYRAVTRACRNDEHFPPKRGGPKLFRRRRPAFGADLDARAAERVNTAKRALMTVSFDRRAALLLRDLVRLGYAEMGRALECSPEAAARQLAAARREFGSVYREIAL